MNDSRLNLKRVLSETRKAGYTFYVGIEPEHFLVTRDDDGAISVWDPDGRRQPRQAMLRLQGDRERRRLP